MGGASPAVNVNLSPACAAVLAAYHIQAVHWTSFHLSLGTRVHAVWISLTRIFRVPAREEIPDERKIQLKIRVSTIVFTRNGSRKRARRQLRRRNRSDEVVSHAKCGRGPRLHKLVEQEKNRLAKILPFLQFERPPIDVSLEKDLEHVDAIRLRQQVLRFAGLQPRGDADECLRKRLLAYVVEESEILLENRRRWGKRVEQLMHLTRVTFQAAPVANAIFPMNP
jgi:hypothetical protein